MTLAGPSSDLGEDDSEMEVELISWGTKQKVVDSREQGSSAYESDEWDEGDEISLIESKSYLETRTNKVWEELPLKGWLWSATRQEAGDGCTKEYSREIEI